MQEQIANCAATPVTALDLTHMLATISLCTQCPKVQQQEITFKGFKVQQQEITFHRPFLKIGPSLS